MLLDLHGLINNQNYINKVYIILADECSLYSNRKPCDASSDLCTEAVYEHSYIASTDDNSKWQKTASPAHILMPEISRLLRLALHDSKETKFKRLHELVLADKLTGNQQEYLDTLFPIVRIWVYCSPCSCLLMTAIELCNSLQTHYVQTLIRPDYRIRSTCCPKQIGLQRTREIADRVRGAHCFEPEGYEPDYLDQLENIDLIWLEKQIFASDLEPTPQGRSFGFGYEETGWDITILLGEAAVLGPEMIKPPFSRRPRVPKQSEVYLLSYDYYTRTVDTTHAWNFSGRFTSCSTYQWSSLDPTLNSIQESSPSSPSPPPSPSFPSATVWSMNSNVQRQNGDRIVPVSVPGSGTGQESKQELSL
jgi:hypothetical protein